MKYTTLTIYQTDNSNNKDNSEVPIENKNKLGLGKLKINSGIKSKICESKE